MQVHQIQIIRQFAPSGFRSAVSLKRGKNCLIQLSEELCNAITTDRRHRVETVHSLSLARRSAALSIVKLSEKW